MRLRVGHSICPVDARDRVDLNAKDTSSAGNVMPVFDRMLVLPEGV